ncbi:hypothetical protein [Roseateles depolymerans]|uniref:Uncharacterized protein n=1 Tax=Roseateles depolymerans TaxID=76731 RepID=A0A0U3MFH3_9BURK|nr:hypothetical protein [Roseateles depolymerans]ALV07533.1 hypothetical protein RD2015_3072 [Roseateles depolymerans]REG22251.1 hypothetical protein DES44_1395 [Roseateles depolymerans]
MNTTSIKALVFGFIATAVLAAGVVHAEVKRERAASVITLETVYITGKRVVAQQEVQTLPTVYVTGRRTTEVAQNEQVAAL